MQRKGHIPWNKGLKGIHLSPGTEFIKGQVPWNAGLKGFHPSPGTSFKPGQVAHNKLPVGSITIRTFKRDNRQRAFVKISEPNIWIERAKIVWEANYGLIEKGMLVHHEDRDTLNDDINNLRLKTRAEHLIEHRPEFEVRRRLGLQRRKSG